MANRMLFVLLIFNLLIGSTMAQLSDTSFTVFGDAKYKIKFATRETSPSREENNALLSLITTDGKKNVTLLADSLFCQRTFIQWKDFNNDGIEDLMLFHASSARSNWTYYLYVMDQKKKRIHRIDGFEEIANPEFVKEDNVITSYTLTGKSYYSFYRINNRNQLIDFKKSFDAELDERDSIQYERVMREIRALPDFIIYKKDNVGSMQEGIGYYFYAAGISCDSVIITSNNGKVYLINENPCYFILHPEKYGPTRIEAFTAKNSQPDLKIGELTITVEEPNTAIGYVGPWQGGLISKEKLILMGGMRARIRMGGDEEPIRVVSYNVIVVRNGEVRGTLNMGNRYEAKTLELLNTLQHGDKVCFINIITSFPRKHLYTTPLEFIIK